MGEAKGRVSAWPIEEEQGGSPALPVGVGFACSPLSLKKQQAQVRKFGKSSCLIDMATKSSSRCPLGTVMSHHRLVNAHG